MGRKRITTPDGTTIEVVGEMQTVYHLSITTGERVGEYSYVDIEYARYMRKRFGGTLTKFIGWRVAGEAK